MSPKVPAQGGEDEPPHGAYADAPKRGVRFELVLEEHEGTRAVYQGFAFTPETRLPLVIVAEVAQATGSIAAGVDATSDPSNAPLLKAAIALVRAATKAELATGAALPRKIVRWREV